MTKEQIEKTATESCVIDNSIFNPEYVPYYEHGFIDGANWRISSVWHKPSAYGEELKRDVEVIVKTKRGYRFGKFEVVGYSKEYIAFVSPSSIEYALSDVLEYAYLDDLLPDGKEVEP